MVTKRQKLARRKFKQENPALFPKPEPTPPKDPNKPKKKKSLFKRKKKNATEPRDPSKRSTKFTKRPLRVPGMKPGDTCYICKAVDHIAKLCPQKAEWERNKICLLCRQRGHSLQRCPNKEDETVGAKLCYNCGESGHSLANCLQPRQDGGTKFANCFICNEHGHLSKGCPKNAHGIYPKGGCCKICSGVTHLARDCPDKGLRFAPANDRQAFRTVERPTGKLTKFISGDELDDDFMPDSSAYSSEQTGKSSDPNDEATKFKKKQGPKVVNFEG